MNAQKKRSLLIASLALAVAIGLAVALYTLYGKRHVESVNCGNCMVAISIGARTWAEDNGGHLASNFRLMSNELSTVRILVCPGDRQRVAAKNWEVLDTTNCSYEIVAPDSSADGTTNVYFRCKVHGYVAYADGAVFDGKRRITKVRW